VTDRNLITTQEAAKLAGISPRRLTILAKEGRIEGRKVSGRWKLDPASVQAYVASQALPAILEQPEKLEAVYREAGSYIAAAQIIGCNKKTVAKAIKRHGIKPHACNATRRPRRPSRPRNLRTTARDRNRRRWIDMAVIFLERGLKPIPLEEMCPMNCPGRSDCLDGHCIHQERGAYD